MEPATIFSISNSFVLIGWLLLLLLPNWKHSLSIIKWGVILLLSLVYAYLILPTLIHFDPNMFASLENVRQLFQDDNALTAGWVHYLAFDLLTGLYIVEQSQKIGIARWQYSLCLPFTFLFGPLGWLGFSGLKLLHTTKR